MKKNSRKLEYYAEKSKAAKQVGVKDGENKS